MSKNKLFIGNLSFSVTEEDLEAEFSQFGNLDEVKIIIDRESGRSRGFAFITFDDEVHAEAALVLDGKNLQGRSLRVSLATERSKHHRKHAEVHGSKHHRRF